MTLTALLLAGGQSVRMGVDKACLTWGGKPLWARQINALRRLNPEALWISARTRPDWCPPGIEVSLDRKPSRGPLSGLAPALRQLTTTHLLVLAVDLPRITTAHLRLLCSLASPGCGVAPRHDEYFEPLCAVYPREAADCARACLAGRDASLQAFIRLLLRKNLMQIYPLRQSEKSLYRNMNTPADFQAESAK